MGKIIKRVLTSAIGTTILALGGAVNAEEQSIEEVMVFGKFVGKGETRANVKIDTSNIEQLPSGMGAAQLLERVSGIQVGSSDALGGGGFDSTVNMRGFSKDQIGFSIDGIPNGRTTLGGGAVPNRFVDTPNLGGIDVSQSAGVVGSPSRQALVGHVNYLTQDPKQERAAQVDLSVGSHNYQRYFVRFDTGEIADGLTGYLSLSDQDYDVWIGEGTGDQERFHVDLKLVKELNNGGSIKFRNSYNDRDGVGYNIVSYLQTPCADEPRRCFFDPFAPSNPAFTLDKDSDGYTDDWTGDPMVDRLHRSTRGNEREDNLSYFEINLPLTEELNLVAKPYYHTQEGIGRFANHQDEGAVPDPIDTAGDPIIYFRNNSYEMDRYGIVVELNGEHNELLNWTAGVWYEDYNRTQVRTWHELANPAAGPAFISTPYHTSEDKEWDNKVTMFYASNKSVFMDGLLTLEYGITFLDNEVDYSAPIQNTDDGLFNISSEFSEDSGIAPKIGVLVQLTDHLELFAGYAENVASITDGVMEDVGDEASSGDNIKIDLDLDEAEVFDIGLRYTKENFAFGIQAFALESEEFTPIDLANSLASTTVSQGRKVKGIELTFNADFGQFEIYAAYTAQDHEYDNEAHVPFTRDGADLVGIPTDNGFVELTWKPIENLRIALNAKYVSERAGFYADPLSSSGLTSGFDFVNAFLVDIGVRTQAELDSVTSSSEDIPSYTLLGLDASYSMEFGGSVFESLKFNFNVDNLTDKEYLSGVAPELLGVDRKWAGRYFIGSPRTVTFTVSAEF